MSNKKVPLTPRIGIDLMGSDVEGTHLLKELISLAFEEDVFFTFLGTASTFQNLSPPSHCEYRIVTEEITAEENPLIAALRKKDSSLNVGIKLLKTYEIDAFITAGNTAALLAAAKLSLPMLTGINRPALMTLIPTKLDPVAVLDIGANVKVRAKNLLQFAHMGIAYQKTRGIQNPKVGLLNIGEEKQKGTPELRKAYEILQELNKNAPFDAPVFSGNIEGRDVFHGKIDVLITDGFTGNVFLKTAEGIASFVFEQMQNLTNLEALPEVKSLWTTLKHHLNYTEYPGALLCGVDGIVMKCHGQSNAKIFANSIKSSIRLLKNFFLEKIKAELALA